MCVAPPTVGDTVRTEVVSTSTARALTSSFVVLTQSIDTSVIGSPVMCFLGLQP
jgi:hypothetical protein